MSEHLREAWGRLVESAWDQALIDSLTLTEEDDSADQVRKLIAWIGSTKVAEIEVFGTYYNARAKGKIKWVGVYQPEYERRGVATFLFDEAQHRWSDLNVSHSSDLTDDGRAWKKSLG